MVAQCEEYYDENFIVANIVNANGDSFSDDGEGFEDPFDLTTSVEREMDEVIFYFRSVEWRNFLYFLYFLYLSYTTLIPHFYFQSIIQNQAK